MSAWYGNVHVKTEDRDRVLRAAAEVQQALGKRMYVSPCINGWVALYPEDGGNPDDKVSLHLSKELPDLFIIHVHLLDEGVFTYQVQEAGVTLDEYDSLPSYFGEAEAEDLEACRGDVEVFTKLCPSKLGEIDDVLHFDNPEAEALLNRFANILGLSNVFLNYEDLAAGHTREVIGLPGFTLL
jgi:hypothetical protein